MIDIPLRSTTPPGPATGTPGLTLYGADIPASGAVVVCPGGGYARLAENESTDVARWLVALGVDAYVLRYRVAGGEPGREPLHPAPLDDLRQAMHVVRERGATRVTVMGFSAGGHLAATLARAGTPFELHVFPEGKHGLAQGEPTASAWPSLCATWLAAQGFGPRP
ncbi:alpha/beta hydrolase [Nonomuraea sp. NPDC004186]